MADRTAGVCGAGHGLAVAALPILADKELRVLSVDRQQALAALRTLLVRHIVMAERAVPGLDLRHQAFRVIADIRHKFSALQFPF